MAASFICRRYVLDDNDLSDAFDLLDMDKDGNLSRAEVACLLRTINVDPNRTELNFIFHEMDRNETGKINKHDFLEYMKCPPIHQLTVAELEKQFKEHDRDNDGAITKGELADILTKTADISSGDIIDYMFEETDKENTGKITYNQFIQLMRS
ncbi:unnamed protein product [Bursaphelenchus okinawaensis]|uniref:EF-hand domain-containing protein n=1 Tax=Bursaphelenchus okinawaensis TaxID=465554 RepID=A0A811KNN2_9BILA|nr:unnamed protein product [Bursaphelenchus okinawaensis]CAG9106407.1 unnamed protein product [Bursaphelenchus okinawaensis]